MARFISHTIWCESGAPLELIAFPWCCVGVIGCSKAALGSDSWAEVGQEQLALAPSPAACQRAFKYGPSMPKVYVSMCAYVCACVHEQHTWESTSGRAQIPSWSLRRLEVRTRGRVHNIRFLVNIWERCDSWQISSSSGDDTSTSLSLHFCTSGQMIQPRRHINCFLVNCSPVVFQTLELYISQHPQVFFLLVFF